MSLIVARVKFEPESSSSHESSSSTGNPSSLCVGKYREHMRRSLGLKIC